MVLHAEAVGDESTGEDPVVGLEDLRGGGRGGGDDDGLGPELD